jgi:hypothetical protein
VSLERGPLSLVGTIEELLGINSSCSCVGSLKKLALTSPTSGSRSLSIVRSRMKVTEFLFYVLNESRTLDSVRKHNNYIITFADHMSARYTITGYNVLVLSVLSHTARPSV